MKVENIKINDYSININKLKKDYSINEKQLEDIIPKLNKKSISFDLINSNEAFANGIRRVFNDELLVKCLNVNISNLNTNDKYLLHDNIIERINLIPINQNIDESIIFNLNIENNTNDIIKVYSRNIINKNENKVYFNPNILICTLRPNTYLYIKNISINKNYGYIDNIYTLGSFSYKVINTDFKIPSLDNNLKDFHLELITNNNIELDKLIIDIYDNLYFRIKKIQNQINNYDINSKSTDINKLTSELFIINNNEIYEIHIFNEYHTLGNLITKYVFNLDNNIPIINYKLEHPLRHKIVINIKHSEYKNIISDALDNIIKDLENFKTTLLSKIDL